MMNESLVSEHSINASKKNENSFLNRFLSVTVSITALAEIATIWNSFSWMNKFCAIGFLFMLLGSAVSEFTGQRKGFEFLARNPVSLSGYLLIMLAMLVFGLR